MAAKHMVTCRFCKIKFDANAEEYELPSKNMYYHKACWRQKQAALSQEERDEEAFYQYVKQLFHEDYNYITTKKLANQYIKENGYTYSGMLKSLKWFYEVQHNTIDKANGSIGIIPYIYNKAKDYYYSLYLAQIANKEKDINKYIPKVKEIEVDSPRVWIRPPRLFNMEDE